MKNQFKRGISVLVSILMCLGMLATTAFAGSPRCSESPTGRHEWTGTQTGTSDNGKILSTCQYCDATIWRDNGNNNDWHEYDKDPVDPTEPIDPEQPGGGEGEQPGGGEGEQPGGGEGEQPGGGEGEQPGGGEGETPTIPPVETIPDEDVPLIPAPPVVDIPDEEVPLAEEPEAALTAELLEDEPIVEEIPDEEVPLAEEPDQEPAEEPVTEIVDEAVPLADVPQTGDSSIRWGLAALLPAGYLLTLGMRKKDEENV